MPRYYKITDGKHSLYITVDDGGAFIVKDEAGRKVFFSKYQAKLMKLDIENAKELFKEQKGEEVRVEELKEPPRLG